MKEIHCPDPVELMIWLDQESPQPQLIAEHLQSCSRCRQLVAGMDAENQGIQHCLESVTSPDFTGRVLDRILALPAKTKDSSNIFWSILIIASIISATILNYLTLPIWRADTWAVAAAKIYGASTAVFFTFSSISRYIMAQVIPGKPLLPAFSLAAVILLVYMFTQRRYYHVKNT